MILIASLILADDGFSFSFPFGARYFASKSSTLVPSSRMTTDAFRGDRELLPGWNS